MSVTKGNVERLEMTQEEKIKGQERSSEESVKVGVLWAARNWKPFSQCWNQASLFSDRKSWGRLKSAMQQCHEGLGSLWFFSPCVVFTVRLYAIQVSYPNTIKAKAKKTPSLRSEEPLSRFSSCLIGQNCVTAHFRGGGADLPRALDVKRGGTLGC